MANFVYTSWVREKLAGNFPDGSTVYKIMLIDNTYTPDRDDDFVGSGAGSVGNAEITATNYTGGFGGAGRKVVANMSHTVDDTNDRVETDVNDPSTWSSLGGAVNDTIAAAVVITETGATDDDDTQLVAYIDTLSSIATFPFTTNGEDFDLDIGVDGLIHWLTNP